MPETIDPIEEMAARRNAERFLRERAEATANRAALDSRAGRQPETYDDPWESVQSDFQRQFPTVPLAPAAQLFQQTRDASFRQGLVRAPEGGAIDMPRAVAQRTPIAGGLVEAGVQSGISAAARRIRDGGATQEDYIAVGRDASNSEAMGNLGVVGQGLNIASLAPSIGVEFMATGGLGSAASGAARQGLVRAAPSFAGGFAERAVGVGASIASRTALSPSMNAQNIASRLAPDIQVGPDGVRVGQDPGVVGAVARGVGDTAIEIGSEMAGGLLGRFGNPGGRLGTALRRMGYNGMAGEVFEERVGEVLRGLSGVEDNYGMTGNVASGNYGAAFRQLGSELIGFGLYGGGLQTANRIASGQVPPDGGPSIRVVPPLGDAPTLQQEEQHARATATAQDRNARVVAEWMQNAPLEEVERWRGWYGIDQDMIDARREIDLDRAREVADSIAAVTSAVSQVARPDRRSPVDILGVPTTNDPAGTQRPAVAPEAENPIGNSSSSPEQAEITPQASPAASETPEATSVAQTAPNAAQATPGDLPTNGPEIQATPESTGNFSSSVSVAPVASPAASPQAAAQAPVSVKITPAVRKTMSMASAAIGDDIVPVSQALEKTNAKRKKQGQKPLTEKAWAEVVQAMVQDGKAVQFTETPEAIASEKSRLDAEQKVLAEISEEVHREGRGPQAPEWKVMADLRANIAKARQIIAFGPGTFLHRPDVVPPRGLYAERTAERSAPAAAPEVSQPPLQAGRGAETSVGEAGPSAGAGQAVAVDPQGAAAEGVTSTGKITSRLSEGADPTEMPIWLGLKAPPKSRVKKPIPSLAQDLARQERVQSLLWPELTASPGNARAGVEALRERGLDVDAILNEYQPLDVLRMAESMTVLTRPASKFTWDTRFAAQNSYDIEKMWLDARYGPIRSVDMIETIKRQMRLAPKRDRSLSSLWYGHPFLKDFPPQTVREIAEKLKGERITSWPGMDVRDLNQIIDRVSEHFGMTPRSSRGTRGNNAQIAASERKFYESEIQAEIDRRNANGQPVGRETFAASLQAGVRDGNARGYPEEGFSGGQDGLGDAYEGEVTGWEDPKDIMFMRSIDTSMPLEFNPNNMASYRFLGVKLQLLKDAITPGETGRMIRQRAATWFESLLPVMEAGASGLTEKDLNIRQTPMPGSRTYDVMQKEAALAEKWVEKMGATYADPGSWSGSEVAPERQAKQSSFEKWARIDRAANRLLMGQVVEVLNRNGRMSSALTEPTAQNIQWWAAHLANSKYTELSDRIMDVFWDVKHGALEHPTFTEDALAIERGEMLQIEAEEEVIEAGMEDVVEDDPFQIRDEDILPEPKNRIRTVRQAIRAAGGINLESFIEEIGIELASEARRVIGGSGGIEFNKIVYKAGTKTLAEMEAELIRQGYLASPGSFPGERLLEAIIANEQSSLAQQELIKEKGNAGKNVNRGTDQGDQGENQVLEEGQSQAVLREASLISPAHAELAGILSKGIQSNPNLSKANAKAYATAAAEVLSSLSNERAARIAPKLRKAKFFNSTQELGGYLSLEFPNANVLVQDGKDIGGAFHIVNGTIYLDGGVKEAQTSGVYAHEMAHPEFLSIPAKDRTGWSQLWESKIAKGGLGEYAQTDSEEGFCEFARHLFENAGGLESVRGKFPAEFAFFEARGMLPQGGEGRVAAFKELFSEKVADGPLVGDVLLPNKGNVKMMTGTSTGNFSSRASEEISSTGKAEPKSVPAKADILEDAAFNRYGAARRLELARIKSGQTASKKGRDLETVLSAIATHNPHALDQMLSKGVFTYVRTPDGGWQQQTISGPFRDIIRNMAPKDLKADAEGNEGRFGTFILARHITAEFERGLEMLQSEHESVRARGRKKMTLVSYEQRQAMMEFIEEQEKKDPEWSRRAWMAAEEYTKFMNASIQALVETGFYTQDAADRMIADKPEYANLARIQENEDYKPGVKNTRVGSAKKLISPMVTARARMGLTGYLMHKQLANYTLWEGGSTLANGKRGVEGQWEETDKKVPEGVEGDITGLENALEALGMDEFQRAEVIAYIKPEELAFLSSPAWRDNGENTYSMRIDGKPIVIRIHDKLLHDMLTGNQGKNSSMYQAAKAIAGVWGMKGATSIVKTGATSANMVFSPRNFVRDPWAYYQNALKDGQNFWDATVAFAVGHGLAHQAKYQMLRGKKVSSPWADLYFKAGGESNRAFFYVPIGPGEAVWAEARGETPTGKIGKAKAMGVKGIEKGKQLLELFSANEHGPRLAGFTKALRDLGYTEAKIKEAMEASPDSMPIPFNDLAYAMRKGSEITTPFQRTGYATSQWNKVAPFFGAHVAAMAHEGRNWRDALGELKQGKFGPRMKAMAGTLAAFVALEVLHWLTFKDEDWYPELDANQRYNWWMLHKDSTGALWGVPKPQGILRMAGGYLTESLRTGSGDAPSLGMATTAARQSATPRLLPTGIGEAVDVARNRNWAGGPIVPTREENAGFWTNAWRHQGPYIMEQMTGGMASSRVLRGPQEAFKASNVAPNQSVKTVRDMWEDIQGARSQHNPANGAFAREAEYRRLRSAIDRLNELARRARGTKDEAAQREARDRQVEIARAILAR